MKLRFSIRDLLWLTLVVGVGGCGQAPAPAPVQKAPAQIAQEADEAAAKKAYEDMDEAARQKAYENLTKIGEALEKYRKTHPDKFDEHGNPLKPKSPSP